MTERTLSAPKGAYADEPDLDRGLAWARLAARHGINADMVTGEVHTEAEWGWTVDPGTVGGVWDGDKARVEGDAEVRTETEWQFPEPVSDAETSPWSAQVSGMVMIEGEESDGA